MLLGGSGEVVVGRGGLSSSGTSEKGRILRNSAVSAGRVQRSMDCRSVKGITNPKNYKFLNFFLLITMCEHVADVVVKFYSCATYVKGV